MNLSTRRDHSATLLADGRVLVAGGRRAREPGASVRATSIYGVYDATANRWTLGEHELARRQGHAAVLAPDGRVLFFGGRLLMKAEGSDTAWYDPSSSAWVPGPPLPVSRDAAIATRLANGRMLIAGGVDVEVWGDTTRTRGLASAEIFDPKTGAFTPTFPLRSVRIWPLGNREPAVVALPNGDAVIFGGANPSAAPNDTPATAERYSLGAHTWTLLPRGPHDFVEFVALLPDGRVLVLGSVTIRDDARGRRAEFGVAAAFLDPASETWSTVMLPRDFPPLHCALALLPDGRILTSGGERDDEPYALTTALLCDPATGHVTAVDPMNRPRRLHTATTLADGLVLVVGGQDVLDGEPFIPSEVFDPRTGRWTSAEPE